MPFLGEHHYWRLFDNTETSFFSFLSSFFLLYNLFDQLIRRLQEASSVAKTCINLVGNLSSIWKLLGDIQVWCWFFSLRLLFCHFLIILLIYKNIYLSTDAILIVKFGFWLFVTSLHWCPVVNDGVLWFVLYASRK